MLTYTFEDRGKKTYYQYLYEKIREDILEGKLKEGTRLPSKRSFAKHLGLSVMTIESAYAQLLVEGYVFSLEKRGYFVADISKQGPFPVSRQAEMEIVVETGEKKEEEPFLDFSSNQVSREDFPMSAWARLMRQIRMGRSCRPEIIRDRKCCAIRSRFICTVSGEWK